MIRTRFAPSPTGFLHVGGLRTALFAYLFAKNSGGTFILRIEDTDQDRFVEGAVQNILDALSWAGIHPDEGVVLDSKKQVSQSGPHRSYIQSERLPIYKKYIDILLEKGHAYHCFCTKERLDELRNIQKKENMPTGYDGHCRNADPAENQKRIAAGEEFVIRLAMPKQGNTSFVDMVRGEVSFKNELVDDQVLIKSDGFPTYHFAVVVDDHEMEITHVMRGEEWISSTPKHLALYSMFGWETPTYAHLSLLVNEKKQKLSKRHGDVSVEDFREAGYLPNALVNFIVFLGWNPGNDQEIFSLNDLVNEFSFEHVGKAPAVFNREKLDWYNQTYIRAMKTKDLAGLLLPYFLNANFVSSDFKEKDAILQIEPAVLLEKERAKTLKDFVENLSFIYTDKPLEYNSDLLVWKKSTKEKTKESLKKTALFLENQKYWDEKNLEESVMNWIQEHNYSVGDVLWPARVALSGKKNSPGPFEIMAVLGQTKTLERINDAVARC